MKTIPTLLTTTNDEFIQQMDLFQQKYSRIQLDITDGDLVPNLTVQIEEINKLLSEKKVELLPSVEFDFHLMVRNFKEELIKIQKLQEDGMKINTVLINAEMQPDITKLEKMYDFAIGLDVFPKASIGELDRQYSLTSVPAIQIMTVSPGFQGSPFLENMLTKIEQLRVQNYKGSIMIDGGVNANTIPVINSKTYKPDYICIGSYLTKAGDNFETRIAELKELE